LDTVTLIEVGLRDGLQSEPPVATEVKLRWADRLIAAGVRDLQAASFVNPARVPAMADADAVCAALTERPEVNVSALVLNAKGLERAHAVGIRYIDMGLSASPGHSARNTGKSTAEALGELIGMIERARHLGLRVRAAVQCIFGCPPENDLCPEDVAALVKELMRTHPDQIALADSSGQGTPNVLRTLLMKIQPLTGSTPVVLHLHDTHGRGYENLRVGLDAGVRHFDTAFGGLGGCPFIPGAKGNIGTEATVRLLHEWGYQTSVDAAGVAQVSREAEDVLGKVLQ
jgi:hydroxymethylglutaryl-CoA lyase